jgi:hypothetical protein
LKKAIPLLLIIQKTNHSSRLSTTPIFLFLLHDLKGGKDSAAAFTVGGGRYSLKGNNYTEYLEYCSAREWEGHDFHFTVTVRNDTLIQCSEEKKARASAG